MFFASYSQGLMKLGLLILLSPNKVFLWLHNTCPNQVNPTAKGFTEHKGLVPNFQFYFPVIPTGYPLAKMGGEKRQKRKGGHAF
jgi:hypothetical protein